MEAFGLMNLIKSALTATQSEEGSKEKATPAPSEQPESAEAVQPQAVEKSVSAVENPFVTFCARHDERARKLRK